MTDQQDRNEESLETEESKYDREVDEEARRRHDAAERLKQDFPPDRDEPED
jgi:hypothetical protein